MARRLRHELASAADPNVAALDLARRSFGVDVRSLNEKARSVDVVASTDALDSYDEVIEQFSWRLERYAKNPVVLFNHNREGMLEAIDPEDALPIGHAENVRVVDGRLEATIFFVDEKANELGERVWQGFVQKSLRAVSVGFRAHTRREETRNGKALTVLADCELYEISVCPMGANPEAVAKAAIITGDRIMEKRIAELETELTKSTEALSVVTAKHAELETAHADVVGKLVESEKSVGSLTASLAEATEKLAAAELTAKTAANALVAEQVKALVGTKISPAELEEMTELALTSPALYQRMIDKRGTIPMAVGTVVVEDAPTERKTVSADDNGDSLAARVAKRASSK